MAFLRLFDIPPKPQKQIRGEGGAPRVVKRTGLGQQSNRLRETDPQRRRGCRDGNCDRGLLRVRVAAAGEPVDKVVRRPGTGKLHLIFPHQGAGGGELVQVALHAFAVDQVRHIQHHFAVIGQSAADLFVQRHEEPVHLEADSPGTGLALTLAGGILAQIAEILPARSIG